MRQALAVGSRGLGRVWPNPSVGCVIVKDGQIVGRGWTQDGGRPHGEVMALAQAGDRARGATVYVTLEPCSHTGQTPPCAAALIKAGVARVVVAMLDPDPRVNGQGVALLRNAGIEVEVGTCSHETSEQHAGFIKKIKSGRPMVTLKLASSFDGRIATASGESQWITGPIARRLVHAQRARHDAVMVGGGTARKDDPSLTVRGLGIARQPVRVVWSRQLDLPLQGQLAASAQQVPLWIVHAEGADATLCDLWRGLGAKLLPVGCGADRQIDPAQALTALAGAGLTRVYCEGGGAMAASLLRADLVDELVNFTAGLGLGADGLAAIAPLGLAHLAAAQRFDLVETVPVGPDVMSRWRRRA
ncbi:MAG: bifunctional diaminohydroxyphosphoribosylaminopyrimidine deaminase/5-amino-6-(5-phosphoribosylamino)uracil reductase RibD [Paracoccaceae bacterium]